MRVLKTLIMFSVLAFTVWTCKNIDNATPSVRHTFIKLIEGPYDMEVTGMEPVPNGYVFVGNMSLPVEGSSIPEEVTVVFQTDTDGNRITDIFQYSGGTGKAIKQLPTGGYVIVGDSIKTDIAAELIGNVTISSARILFLNSAFAQTGVYYQADRDTSSATVKTDFYGGTVTVDNGVIYILGTYVAGIGNQQNIPEKPYIIALDQASLANDTVKWVQVYDLIDRNYRNTKSIYYNNGKIIWGSAITKDQLESKISYVSVPVVQESSVFVNNSTMGEQNDQLFIISEIAPAKNNAFGYGLIGTYSSSLDGANSNLFFVRTDASGTIIPETQRYFDAILSPLGGALADSVQSEIIDEGLSITATSDGGFVLAGAFESTPLKGNGERDIYLIKISALGDMVWSKTLGGAGDEVVASIRETPDKGLLMCGTNMLAGSSYIFLIKTDRNGELKN